MNAMPASNGDADDKDAKCIDISDEERSIDSASDGDEDVDSGGGDGDDDNVEGVDDAGDDATAPAPSSGVTDSRHYPQWSWERTRVWVAIRRSDDYSDDQIRALSEQDVVMLEKMNGNANGGTVEKGTLKAAKRIKRLNSKVKILFYLNSMVHYGGYEANDRFETEWAMWNPKQKDHYKWRKKFLSYDHTNADFREWWIKRALDMVAHDEIDGVFIDAIVKTDKRFLPKKNHGKAYFKTATELRERLPEGKLLIGNALRANTSTRDGYMKHLDYLDGSYLEKWMDVRRLKPTLDLVTRALKKGRLIMLNAPAWNVDQARLKRLKSLDKRYKYVGEPAHIGFPLGYFLLFNAPGAYFSFRTGVDARPRAKNAWDNTRLEAIMQKLGKPMGEYVRDGDVCTREFEHLKVEVNIKTMEGALTVKGDRGEEL